MINQSEYEKICKLIDKGNMVELQEFINVSYEKGNKKYLLEAKDALLAYLDYYPQSFVKYLDDTSSKENPLVESIFGQKERKTDRIIISDNVSGGFILNDDKIMDRSLEQRHHIYNHNKLLLTNLVTYTQNKSISVIINKIDQIDKNKLKLISDIEIYKSEVSVYGKGYAHPHYFERTRYNAFKLLGEEAKIYISSPRSKPLLYGESPKGKGFVLGLKK